MHLLLSEYFKNINMTTVEHDFFMSTLRVSLLLASPT